MKNNNFEHNEYAISLVSCTRRGPRYDKLIGWLECLEEPMQIALFKDEPIIKMAQELVQIDEELSWHECDNMGISGEARFLRKAYRKQVRRMIKWCKARIRGHLNFQKEWSKPRRVYESKTTGELHNGLWWVIKTIVRHPLIYKFKWEVKN